MKSKTDKRVVCTIGSKSFVFNGKEEFLYSGEVHYFRIPRRYWDKHLERLVAAGCNAVSTYVPWSWHEYDERRIDWTGKTHPERDLLGFLDLAEEHNLYVTLKPGPYVMAETTDQGIPGWLTNRYPETRAIGENGKPWGAPFVSYMSPIFREKAARWLTDFAGRVVAPRQTARHAPLIMLQLCNEIGIFSWLGMQADYSVASLNAWWTYLRKRFPRLQDLAVVLDRDVSSYETVAPPQKNCSSRRDYVLYQIFHDYLRWAYANYVSFLHTTLRRAGVQIPLFVNIGGWVFGRAHEFCMNATFHRETASAIPDLLYGLDHIPEFISPLNAHDGIVANQLAMELQRRKGPVYSAELQCGSREHGVETYPPELALFYRQCIAHGLTGMNFYMFAQGRNPKGRGTDGPMFYWYNAVNYKAEPQPTFKVVQDLGEWIRFNEARIIRSTRPSDLAVAFYPPLHETELLFSTLHKKTRLEAHTVGLSMDPLEFRSRAFFDGIIRILNRKNVPFDLVDVQKRMPPPFTSYSRMVLASNEIMDTESQKKLVEYVRRGGTLIVFPMLPKFDRFFAPCRIMEDSFDIHTNGRSSSNRVDMGLLQDIPVPQPPWVLVGSDVRMLAKDAQGQVVGIEKTFGKGRIRMFGFFVYYSIEEHLELLAQMMECDRVARNAWTNSDELNVAFRRSGREGILFVGNFHRTARSAAVWVRNPRGADALDLGTIEMPALTGLLLPIQTNVGRGVTLRFAYGELLDASHDEKRVRMILRGPARTQGRISLQAPNVFNSMRVDGEPVPLRQQGASLFADYEQTGSRQILELS